MAHKNQIPEMAKQEVNSPLIVTVGIVSVLLLVVIAVGLEAWFRYEEANEVADKWAESQNVWLNEMREKQHANLGNIDQAIRQVAQQNQGKSPSASVR